jgi:hypothetical protein
MKRSRGLSRLIFIAFIIFISMLAVNTAVMKMFFNINVFDLRYVKAAMLKSERNSDGQRQLGGAGDGQVYENGSEDNGTRTANSQHTGSACGEGTRQVYGDGIGLATCTDSADESGYCILPEEIESLKHLSLQDKLFALSIISKIDRDVKERIYEMSKDGVTYSEFAEIKRSVENFLVADDIESLEEIFLKNRATYAERNK